VRVTERRTFPISHAEIRAPRGTVRACRRSKSNRQSGNLRLGDTLDALNRDDNPAAMVTNLSDCGKAASDRQEDGFQRQGSQTRQGREQSASDAPGVIEESTTGRAGRD